MRVGPPFRAVPRLDRSHSRFTSEEAGMGRRFVAAIAVAAAGLTTLAAGLGATSASTGPQAKPKKPKVKVIRGPRGPRDRAARVRGASGPLGAAGTAGPGRRPGRRRSVRACRPAGASGPSAIRIGFDVPAGTAETEIVSAGGLVLKGACSAGGDLSLEASSTANNARARALVVAAGTPGLGGLRRGRRPRHDRRLRLRRRSRRRRRRHARLPLRRRAAS